MVSPDLFNWGGVRVNFADNLSEYANKLKEYYEIVDEARPLSGFFPTHANFFTECISNHETKQASKF